MTTPDDDKVIIRRSVDIYVSLAVVTLIGYLALDLISPFVSILLWSVILSVGIFPVYQKLSEWFGGHTGWAGTAIAVIFLLLLLVPTFLIVQSIIDSVSVISTKITNDEFSIPPPDASVAAWPLIGNQVYGIWSDAHENLEKVLTDFAPQLKSMASSAIGLGTSLLSGVLQFALSVVFAAVFLVYSQPLQQGTNIIANRVAKTRGAEFVSMAGATIRNVSRGVIGIAIIQGGAASIGYFVAGFPLAGILSAIVIASTIVQVPALVIIPSIIYAWSDMSTTGALLFTAWMIPVMLSDNVLKPVLMARGLTTPMIVIFMGVIGGTLSSGLLGLFIGPVILAVFYEMVLIWIRSMDQESQTKEDASAPGA
ncbi:MAG: AI-2E family transporter [Pseudomonadota bacterium]